MSSDKRNENSFLVSDQDAPVFVRGLSRSGGTLLVTLLDAHPEIAMSYELYPTLLKSIDSPSSLESFLNILLQGRSNKVVSKELADRNLNVFFARAQRGGLNHRVLGQLVSKLRHEIGKFDDDQWRFKLIELCAKQKMKNEGKSFWGLKCNNSYKAYSQAWPRARFINIIRDGRDVLASQQNTGSFEAVPEAVAKSWKSTHLRFREFTRDQPARGLEIRYEELVQSPLDQLKKITRFLNLDFNSSMLAHSKENLTLFQSSHLSLNEVKKPINDGKVGRWKKDLTESDLKLFLSVAQDTLLEFGYEV